MSPLLMSLRTSSHHGQHTRQTLGKCPFLICQRLLGDSHPLTAWRDRGWLCMRSVTPIVNASMNGGVNMGAAWELEIIREQYPSQPLHFLPKTLRLPFEEGMRMLQEDGKEVCSPCHLIHMQMPSLHCIPRHPCLEQPFQHGCLISWQKRAAWHCVLCNWCCGAHSSKCRGI